MKKIISSFIRIAFLLGIIAMAAWTCFWLIEIKTPSRAQAINFIDEVYKLLPDDCRGYNISSCAIDSVHEKAISTFHDNDRTVILTSDAKMIIGIDYQSRFVIVLQDAIDAKKMHFWSCTVQPKKFEPVSCDAAKTGK